MIELTRKQLAELCKLTPPRISQLVDEGVLTRNKNRKYDLEQISEYIEFLRKQQDPDSDIRELIDREKYRELKRENDKADNLVAPVEALEHALEKTVGVMIPHLEMLPLNMKRVWPEITGDQVQMVKQVVAECRNAMAEAEIEVDV